MRYILDTHSLLWECENDDRLSKTAKEIILDWENLIFVSMASIWEICIKSSIGKLDAKQPVEKIIAYLKETNIQLLQIEIKHTLAVKELSFHHQDPFDRMIIAQAIEHNLTIITKDQFMPKYDVKTVW